MINCDLKNISKKNILVTGGAGFIGSNLVKFFFDNEIKTYVVDNLSTGFLKNIKPYSNFVDFYNVDICNFKDLESVFRDCNPDIVFHMAALPGVLNSVIDPCKTNDVNISGLLNVLKLSSDFFSQKLIFSSSSSVYGGSEDLPTNESSEKNPKSPYAVQKLSGEEYCRVFSSISDLDTVSLRYFNVFGPRQNPDSEYSAVIASFCNSVKNSTIPKIYGSGEQFRDFCYIDNVIYANILVALSDKKFNGDIFNVGTGNTKTVNSLCSIIGTRDPEYFPKRSGDVFCSQADISKISKLVGYSPITDFKSGIEKTLDYYLGE